MERNSVSLEQALNILPDGVIIINEDARIHSMNEQAGLLFDYEPDELAGQQLNVLIPAGFHRQHDHHVKDFFHNPAVRKMGAGHVALFGQKKNGSEFDVDVALSPIEIEGQKLVIAVIRDITDKKDLERMLLWRNEQLQVINTELEKFSYTVSHDLKSPLANIQALIFLLMRELPNEQGLALQEYVQHLNQSVQAMGNLISGIATYSSHGTPEATELISLNEVMGEVRNLVLIPPNLTLEVADNLPEVQGNRTKLLQVFLNLITNAIKYNDKQEARIRISCADNGSTWQICFDDNGPGIPEELREKVFELFEKGTSKRSDSQGLGLAIVKKIIKESGGNIQVTESVMGGARFDISLPKSGRAKKSASSVPDLRLLHPRKPNKEIEPLKE